nr:unnamed protein product [Digitaria exilis]
MGLLVLVGARADRLMPDGSHDLSPSVTREASPLSPAPLIVNPPWLTALRRLALPRI